MKETATLAQYFSDLQYRDLPSEVVATAKMCVLDSLGVALAATRWEWTDIVSQVVLESGGKEESTVWGRGFRVPAQEAALANGTAIHGIEMDDRVPKASVHPGSYVVSSAMAVAEMQGLDGENLIASVVAGYELGMRIGFAVHFIREGLHQSGHKGIWPAIGAAGRAFGLTAEQMLNAYGIAGSMAAGLAEFSQDPQGTMVKRLHAGQASHNGVMAARLAQRGFTGPRSVIEGKYGYSRVFVADGEEMKFELLTRDLGTSFRMLEREVKPYAAWGGSHIAIDAVGEILSDHPIEAKDIAKIEIGGSLRLVNDHHAHPEPRSTMAGQYSLPFLTALAFCRGPQALMDPEGTWTEETLKDPEILSLSKRTELYLDDDLEERSRTGGHYGGGRVAVTMRDGTQHEAVVYHSTGTLENPITEAELQNKFRRLAGRLLPEDRLNQTIDTISNLEDLSDVRELAQLLSPAS